MNINGGDAVDDTSPVPEDASAEGSLPEPVPAVAHTTQLDTTSLPPRIVNLTVKSVASGNDHQVFLLGTAHISDVSVDDAV